MPKRKPYVTVTTFRLAITKRNCHKYLLASSVIKLIKIKHETYLIKIFIR